MVGPVQTYRRAPPAPPAPPGPALQIGVPLRKTPSWVRELFEPSRPLGDVDFHPHSGSRQAARMAPFWGLFTAAMVGLYAWALFAYTDMLVAFAGVVDWWGWLFLVPLLGYPVMQPGWQLWRTLDERRRWRLGYTGELREGVFLPEDALVIRARNRAHVLPREHVLSVHAEERGYQRHTVTECFLVYQGDEPTRLPITTNDPHRTCRVIDQWLHSEGWQTAVRVAPQAHARSRRAD